MTSIDPVPSGAGGKEPACQCRRPKRRGLKFRGWAGRPAHLSWHTCWTGWFMMASAGTAGASVCAASYPPASLKLITRWQGFREQQERASPDAQTLFKPLLCHLRSLPFGQSKSRGQAWSQWGGHSELQHKGSWIQGEGERMAILCSLL